MTFNPSVTVLGPAVYAAAPLFEKKSKSKTKGKGKGKAPESHPHPNAHAHGHSPSKLPRSEGTSTWDELDENDDEDGLFDLDLDLGFLSEPHAGDGHGNGHGESSTASIYAAIKEAFREIRTSKTTPKYSYSASPLPSTSTYSSTSRLPSSSSTSSSSNTEWLSPSPFSPSSSTSSSSSHSASSLLHDLPAEVELAWTSSTVIASVGGVPVRRWSVGLEGQDIQWACWGYIEQPGGLVFPSPLSSSGSGGGGGGGISAASPSGSTSAAVGAGRDLHSITPTLKRMRLRPTFGPFAESSSMTGRGGKRRLEKSERCRGLFVFLRSVARIWMDNGREYTVHLPFLVRKAWPLHPVGVLVQRVLSKEEEVEAARMAQQSQGQLASQGGNGNGKGKEKSTDEVLPTIYSLSDPLSEFRVVCTSSTITGGLTPQEPTASIPSIIPGSEPPPSIQPGDKIIWTSEGEEAHEKIFVTVDMVQGRFWRVWRYAHVVPDEEAGMGDGGEGTLGGAVGNGLDGGAGVESEPLSMQFNFPILLNPTGSDSNSGSGEQSQSQSQTLQTQTLQTQTSTQGTQPITLPSQQRGRIQGQGHQRVVSGSLADLPLPDSGYPLDETQDPRSQPTLSGAPTLTSTQGWVGGAHHERNDSGTRNELSATLDRMALGSQTPHNYGTHGEQGNHDAFHHEQARMKPAYWAHELFSDVIPDADMKNPSKITAAIFDSRSDLKCARCLLALCFPETGVVSIYSLTREDDGLQIAPLRKYDGIAITAIYSLRRTVQDLLILQLDNTLRLLVGPLTDMVVDVDLPNSEPGKEASMTLDQSLELDEGNSIGSIIDKGKIIGMRDTVLHHTTLVLEGGAAWRISMDYTPQDELTRICMECMACVLPDRVYFSVFRSFLQYRDGTKEKMEEFEAFKKAVLDCCHIVARDPESANVVDGRENTAFGRFLKSNTIRDLHRDPVAAAFLRLPDPPKTVEGTPHAFPPMPHHHKSLFKLILSCFHLLLEDFKLSVTRRWFVDRLCTLLVQLAAVFRPEWLDYYARTSPDLAETWETPRQYDRAEEDIPVVGPSIFSHLYTRLTSSERSWPSVATVMVHKDSLPMERNDPWRRTRRIDQIYVCFTDSSRKDFRSRAELVVETMVALGFTLEELDDVPYGIAVPIRECLRACQMSPPSEWPLAAYELVGRQDLAEMAKAPNFEVEEEEPGLGEKPIFEEDKKSIQELMDSHQRAMESNANKALNEMELGKLTKIRFTTDRRLDEVTRILQGSIVQTIKLEDRPMGEHDLAKEQQLVAGRIAERTMALAMGRALFTFGTVMNVTNETYRVPKLEFSVRMLPMNVVVNLEAGKPNQDSLNWAEFHNGVAAGLRIAPSSNPIASSWITFNKPSELSPGHAGFLYGLGLTGHLKSMLTWHTFTYLTPKHDLTSIAVLLGLSAAYKGTGNRHVRKLLAIHTPALLPKSSMELNIPLLTQAAGISGVGLLYMGTAHRRMAEVCLGEMYKKDTSSISSTSNETKEAYVVSAALAFGMIMLARGFSANNFADEEFVSRLKTMIYGVGGNGADAPFDVNATSPAACIALGLMFLRTNRQDIAEIMLLPDSLAGLNRVPPHFLFYRALGRDLIMWNDINPTLEWIMGHFPHDVRRTMEARARGVKCDIAFEYAYYYTVAGACFAIGLKYAGTAKEQAYLTLMHFYDLYSKLSWTPAVGGYDYRIRKAAVREGLNMIALALSIVMAGVGEIHCLRRFRFSHGQIQYGSRYGSHVANVMSIGMLFLGGGHFTLGNSDAAIASLVAACFPPFPFHSSDNRCHLQALRHLWVLAIEPRCLIARDISTKEVVYLPIKTHVREDDGLIRATQLISPTLIPNLSRLMAIKVDTPRYWPFLLDLAKVHRHRERIIQDQTLWVKRKTGFLGYSEDPKGSRSIFIRAGAASGDAVMLEFPLAHKKPLEGRGSGPSKDFKDFVSSFSIEPEHLAFADRLCRMDDFEPSSPYALFEPPAMSDGSRHVDSGTGWGRIAKDERTKKLEAFAHAAFLECLTLDKAELLPAHMEVHILRSSNPERGAGFNMRLENLVFATGFYTTVFEKRFTVKHTHSHSHEHRSGPGTTVDAYEKVPLMRPAFLLAALLAIDETISSYRSTPSFRALLANYCTGERLHIPLLDKRRLSTYLVRENVPSSDLLVQLRALAASAFADVENGSGAITHEDKRKMRGVIRAVLHETAVNACKPSMNKWSMKSLEEVLGGWNMA